jgi:glycosyltransferase involved in cell wall biosynthesis
MISGDRALASGKKGAFYNTLEELHKHFDRIDIITPRITNYELRIKEIFGNVFIYPSPWPIWLQPFWIFLKGKALSYDIATVHEYPPFYNGLGAWLLWRKTHKPFISEIHHIPGYPRDSTIKEKIYKLLTLIFINYITKHSKAIRIVNENQSSEFLKRAGISENKMLFATSQYIDLEIFRPIQTIKEYDLIFVGRLEENKGISLLLKAVSNIKLQIPNIKCLIVGDGSLKKHLSLEINHLSLRNNVLLYGFAKDSAEIAGLINKSRILIMSSYNEGGPRVVLEALACGVPVVATNVGIVPDLNSKGRFGGLISDWNSDDMARKIGLLLTDSNLYNKLRAIGLSNIAQYEKRDAIKNYANKLKILYDENPHIR